MKSLRPNWDDYFMAIARIISTRATCDRLHTGAVLVKNNRIVSTGYNGAPSGLDDCDTVGHLLEDGHCVRTIHGEHNAILQAAVIGGASTSGATLYTLYSPCIHCAKYVAAANITRIVIGKMYRNEITVDYLRDAGISVDVYTPSEGWYGSIASQFTGDIPERDGQPVELSTAS